jgi:hypothetical protein
VGAHHPAAGVHQPIEQRGGDREGRVGHHVERATWQPQVGSVGGDDHDGVAEPLAQGGGPAGMALDGDHPRAGRHERLRERAGAGADVEHQVARAHLGEGDDPLSPGVVELVPAPGPP